MNDETKFRSNQPSPSRLTISQSSGKRIIKFGRSTNTKNHKTNKWARIHKDNP